MNDLKDWVEEVRDLLWKVAHDQTEIGKQAECLGSYIPQILERLDQNENLPQL